MPVASADRDEPPVPPDPTTDDLPTEDAGTPAADGAAGPAVAGPAPTAETEEATVEASPTAPSDVADAPTTDGGEMAAAPAVEEPIEESGDASASGPAVGGQSVEDPDGTSAPAEPTPAEPVQSESGRDEPVEVSRGEAAPIEGLVRLLSRDPDMPSRRRFLVRRLVAAVIVLVLLAGAGVAVAAVTRSGSARSGPARRTAGPPPATAAASDRSSGPASGPGPIAGGGPAPGSEFAPAVAGWQAGRPVPPSEPGGGQTLFPSHRLVAFYGAPAAPTLGVLGNAPPAQLWSQLEAASAPFATPGAKVVPSYELIAFTAQAAAGPDGSYSSRISNAEIGSYLQVVKAHGGMLILDIQPGLSHMLADAESLAPWLIQPDVGLALDPEWEISPGQLPGQVIGHTTATEINQVSAWLARLTAAHHLPQKLLLIHQFLASMVVDKAAVAPRADLATAFNMDGFGPADKKAVVYGLLSSDPRWALGYKLFYQRDTPLQTPAEVLALRPVPDIVEYE